MLQIEGKNSEMGGGSKELIRILEYALLLENIYLNKNYVVYKIYKKVDSNPIRVAA